MTKDRWPQFGPMDVMVAKPVGPVANGNSSLPRALEQAVVTALLGPARWLEELGFKWATFGFFITVDTGFLGLTAGGGNSIGGGDLSGVCVKKRPMELQSKDLVDGLPL